eukprot:10111997-Ditylum_brightwellii.AAC.1
MRGGFCARMKTQQRYEWRNNNPQVLKQIEAVHAKSKRKFKGTMHLTLSEIVLTWKVNMSSDVV